MSLTIAESRRAFFFDGKRGCGDWRHTGVAIALLGCALENGVGERRDVRVDAPQVANNAQKITVVDAAGEDRVRSLCGASTRTSRRSPTPFSSAQPRRAIATPV